jgi:hypothetical protein
LATPRIQEDEVVRLSGIPLAFPSQSFGFPKSLLRSLADPSVGSADTVKETGIARQNQWGKCRMLHDARTGGVLRQGVMRKR